MFRQQCLEDPNLPSDLTPEELCGSPMTAADLRPEDFLSQRPFSFADTGLDGAVAFGGAAAVVAFVAGATFIGAEWSTRSVVALLFWAPRHTTVMGAKLTALVLGAATFGVLAQIGWLAMAGALSATVGDGRPLPEGRWGELLATGGRGVLLTVLAALLGFGLANLVRNTAAALGIAFVYFGVVENVLRAAQPRWQPWLLSNNGEGLIWDGGKTLHIWPNPGDEDWTRNSEPVEYLLTNLQAGVYLTVVCTVVVGIGVLLFARRDMH